MEDYAEVLDGEGFEALFVDPVAFCHRVEGVVFFVFRLDLAQEGCEVVEAGEVALGSPGFVARLTRFPAPLLPLATVQAGSPGTTHCEFR